MPEKKTRDVVVEKLEQADRMFIETDGECLLQVEMDVTEIIAEVVDYLAESGQGKPTGPSVNNSQRSNEQSDEQPSEQSNEQLS